MKHTDTRLVEFLAALRSPDPAPGGGAASALGGALGASLLAMVAAMPKHRAAAGDEIERFRSAGQRCSELTDRLTTLIDRDSDAYERVMTAYRLPKGTDAERAARSARIQEVMPAAVEAPLEVLRACAAALETAPIVAQFGNPNAASDVGVAVELLIAGARGAALNVQINLPHVKDAEYVHSVRTGTAALLEACERGAAAARASPDSRSDFTEPRM